MPTMLTTQDKEDIRDIIVDVMKEVLFPVFETLATKEDLAKVGQKLDRVATNVLEHEQKLQNPKTPYRS